MPLEAGGRGSFCPYQGFASPREPILVLLLPVTKKVSTLQFVFFFMVQLHFDDI